MRSKRAAWAGGAAAVLAVVAALLLTRDAEAATYVVNDTVPGVEQVGEPPDPTGCD
jgi:hypothetical protein